MKTRRTLLALVLSVMMVIGLFPITAMATDNQYLAYNETKKIFELINIPNDIKEVSTASWTDTESNPGWYIARGTVEIPSRVTVSGDVHLILANDCELTVNGGIQVDGSNSLTIYAQSTDKSTMGQLIAQNNVEDGYAALGSNNGNSNGTFTGSITINGGRVRAVGSSNGHENSFGILAYNVTVNGGSVQAVGGDANNNSYGIYARNVTVTGGSVEAKGGNANNNSNGIDATNVTVTGGSVEAVGGDVNNNSHGIRASNVTVNGGSVVAEGGSANNSNGIFAKDVTVNGGSAVVFASSIFNSTDFNSTDRSNWNGIVFEGNDGQVYGDATIPNGATLTVPNGATLTVPNGATLTNSGTIIVYGTISGTISGKSVEYGVTIVDGGENVIGAGSYAKGNKVTLTPGTKAGYKFDSWKSSDVEISADGTFEMPEKAVTVKANWKPVYTVTVDGAELAEKYAEGDTVTLNAGTKEGYTFAGWTSEEVTVDENGKFTMPAKDVTVTAKWTENPVEPVQPEPPSEPEYIPIPDPDYTAPVYRDTWHKSGKNWYFYDEDGQKVKGWYKDGNTWYYLSEKTGAMVYGGMLEIDGETYYFYDWGGMASNWWYLDETTGDWYYFRGNGAMAKNTWIEWKGEWYYLGADGRMLTGTTTPDGYRVDANGAWVR